MSDQAALPSDYAERAAAVPANTWTFRRIAFFAVVTALLLMRWRQIELMPATDLKDVAHDDTILIFLIVFLYFVGPTAEHFVRVSGIVQSFWPFGKKPA